jgi:KipI family sensor histidine kinase inhibitor
MTPRLLPLGDSAWTVEFGHAIDAATNARVMGLAGRVAAARQNDPLLAPVTDVVPTFRSLTVHFDPWAGDATALGRQLLSMAQEGQQTTVQGRQWQLPVCFDDDFAPDLPRVCELKQLSRSEVISQLLGAAFRVYMLGFQPGFPYMGGLPPTLVTPRLPSPRQKVPAKSVAIALDMCSVYPWESPGAGTCWGARRWCCSTRRRPNNPPCSPQATRCAGPRWTAPPTTGSRARSPTACRARPS